MIYELYENMMYNLPDFYQESKVVTNLMREESNELGEISLAMQDLLSQFFISTATWGLVHWENAAGLPTDLNQSYVDRRSLILAKLRGTGTVTKAMIQNVAQSFVRGTVVVHEITDNYEINIEFIDENGIPANIELIKQALQEIIPAHLQVTFAYNWLTFAELDELIWDDIEGKTWDELEIYR
jgi:uncharacterized protein YmfQ (DUF2313 family)